MWRPDIALVATEKKFNAWINLSINKVLTDIRRSDIKFANQF